MIGLALLTPSQVPRNQIYNLTEKIAAVNNLSY
jgi:hypothetical protein